MISLCNIAVTFRPAAVKKPVGYFSGNEQIRITQSHSLGDGVITTRSDQN